MAEAQVHIINKQVFDLRMPSRENAFAVQGRVSELYHARILPILDKVLNELVPPGEVIVIDKIEIDLETIGEDELEEKFPEIFAGKIREELAAHLRSPAKSIASSASNMEMLKQFLFTGKLPWWAGRQQPDPGLLLEELLSSNSRQLVAMLKEVSASSQAVERLAAQVPEKVRYKLTQLLLHLIAEAERRTITQFFQELFRAAGIASAEQKDYIRLRSLLAVIDNVPFSPSFFANDAQPSIEKQLSMVDHAGKPNAGKGNIAGATSSKIILPSLIISPAARVIMKHAAMIAAGNNHINAIGLVKKVLHELSPVAIGSSSIIGYKGQGNKQEKRTESGSGKENKRQKSYKKDREPGLKNEFLSKEDSAHPTEAIGSDEGGVSKLLEEITEMKPQAQAASLDKDHDDDKDAAYISNAGLVLLAPFFPAFFRSLDLVEEKQFKDHKAALRAVHLLQYLATGNTSTHEYELVFNKLLCGMQVNESIGAKVKLTKTEKAEADQLIADAVTHWKALKNTSVSYFRSAFLEREGILTKSEQGWLLRVERKPYDMLLESLPWGLSMIKLPWTKEMFNVEW